MQSIILASCCLHNYLRSNATYCPTGMVDTEIGEEHHENPGMWRNDPNTCLQGLTRDRRGNASSLQGRVVRDQFKEYFNNSGAVNWQWDRTG